MGVVAAAICRGGLSVCLAVLAFMFLYAILGCARYEWLDESQCGMLADLCEKTPLLAEYRDRVRTEGRLFTVGEMRAMQAWVTKMDWRAEQARQHADCQRLYGLASSTESGPTGAAA